MNTLVFVYGSLKKDRGNDHLLDTSEYVMNVSTLESRFTMVDWGSYPAVCLRGKTQIRGELYSVSAEVFESLDRLEGYPSFYDRSKVLLEGGGVAWMYHIDSLELENETIVTSGEW